MTDRIGELLSQMAAEDENEDEERREDVLAQKRGAVVSSGLRSERSESGEVPEGRTAFAQSESLGRAANRRSVTTGESAADRPGPAAGQLWKDGPVWRASSTRTEVVGTPGAGAERAARTGPEWTARGGRPGPAETGLEGLYRQTVQGLRPAAPALPPEQPGKTVRTQEPGTAASLAVDELDRAVRRDSRRYDGGMSIY